MRAYTIRPGLTVKEGDTIIASSWGEGDRRGIVDDVDEEGKNGRMTIGFGEHWCYAEQVKRVIPA